MNRKALRQLALTYDFVARPEFDAQRIAGEFSAFASPKGELAAQATRPDARAHWGTSDPVWATGWVELGGMRLNAFLDTYFIDGGQTAAERRYIDERGGRTDRYRLRFTAPRDADPEDVPPDLEALVAAFVAGFLARVGARAADGVCAWDDLP